ncbi:hypothetical protein ZWY2020_036723 [Hordeum vulgare]|nr:hypothetical protein ZWY2020_036723 [Hordeum vulgare]
MRERSIPVSSQVILAIIRRYVRAGMFAEASELFRRMEEYGAGVPDPAVLASLLGALSKKRLAGEAQALFDSYKSVFPPDVVLYTTLVHAWCRAGCLDKAEQVFAEMQQAGIMPNVYTYTSVIDAMYRAGQVPRAQELLCQMMDTGCPPNTATFNAIMRAHVKAGRSEQVLQVHNQMRQLGCDPDIITYNFLMETHCGKGQSNLDAAMKVLAKMIAKGCIPDCHTFNPMLKLVLGTGNVEAARRLYERMQELQCKPNVVTYNLLMKLFNKEKSMDMVLRIKKDMDAQGVEPNVNTYGALIESFCGRGNWRRAHATLREMVEEKSLKPTKPVYDMVLMLLRKAGGVVVAAERVLADGRRGGGRGQVAAPRAPGRKRTSTTLLHLLQLDNPTASSCSPPRHQQAAAAVAGARAESLIDKIASCCRVFTFADDADANERDAKREQLEENQPPGLDHLVMVALVKMLAANLFRTMPPPAACPSLLADAADEEAPAASLLPSWPHLQAVYDVLLPVIAPAHTNALRNHLDRPIHTTRQALLLEICGSIINGFAVPLKEEHRGFLLRVLLPLHRARWLHAYHRQLVYCVLQFVHKEPELAGAVVEGILRRWPVTNCQKEVLLIDELEEIVDALDQRQFDALAAPICSRIARCATSCSSQVAERALYVWNNERFLEMASAGGAMERILPPFVASVEDNLERHWSKCVQQVTASVKALLQQVAPDLYDRCAADLAANRAEAHARAAERDARWRRLEAAADANTGRRSS